MKTRASWTPLRMSLWSALGLSPLLACGGETASKSTDGNTAAGGVDLGTGGTGTGMGGIGAGGTLTTTCKNPGVYSPGPLQPLTGLVACDYDLHAFHRTAQVDCQSDLPRPSFLCYPTASSTCKGDSDCTARPNGYCGSSNDFSNSCTDCIYACVRDSDCAAGEICLCVSPIAQCVPAGCATDQDCGGLLCLSYPTASDCSALAFACQTPADECVTHNDCANGASCVVEADGHRACGDSTCLTLGTGGVGRPFIVEGLARLAKPASRSDWSSSILPCVDELSAETREELAARWTEIGLMEHASIAANARFALELLSLGAPPDLVHGSYEAMADETVHARDAFALASAYAGSPIGPGALDLSQALEASTPIQIVRRAILEGCIGETVCAAEAREALASATDETVRTTLRRVVADETRHAELVWRFVSWVLECGEPGLRASVATSLLDLVIAELHAAAQREPDFCARDTGLDSHGILSAEARREIRRGVLRDVIEPCARALVFRQHERIASAARPTAPRAPDSRTTSWL